MINFTKSKNTLPYTFKLKSKIKSLFKYPNTKTINFLTLKIFSESDKTAKIPYNINLTLHSDQNWQYQYLLEKEIV